MVWSIFAIAVAATILIVISDMDFRWKILAAGLLSTSLAVQFIPFLAERVNFVVPSSINLGLAIWGVIYWRS